MTAPDFRIVKSTQDERDEWKRTYLKRFPGSIPGPPPYRYECKACGKHIWASGLGIGSHRRACKGTTRWWVEGEAS